jgi:hypothetical protein
MDHRERSQTHTQDHGALPIENFLEATTRREKMPYASVAASASQACSSTPAAQCMTDRLPFARLSQKMAIAAEDSTD